jgi:hypothetical protein
VNPTDTDPSVAKHCIRHNRGTSGIGHHGNGGNHLDILLFDNRDHGHGNNQNEQEDTGNDHDAESIRSRKLHDGFHRTYEKAASEDRNYRNLVGRSTLARDKVPMVQDEKMYNEEQAADHRKKG